MKYEDFIVLYDNVIPKELCNTIIQRFEDSPCKTNGVAGTVDGLDKTETKKNTEILVNECLGFEDIDESIFHYVNKYSGKYINQINQYCNVTLSEDYSDTGYLIKKYNVGDGWFDWHHDLCTEGVNQYRTVSIIIYLNDVHVGGCTEFISGTKIKPKEGSILFFPASWQFVHRGDIPFSNSKYIITSFLFEQSATY